MHSMSQVFTKYNDTSKMQEMLESSENQNELIVFKDLHDQVWQITKRPDLHLLKETASDSEHEEEVQQ